MILKNRHYKITDVVSFRKTTEPFGGLSNMASGYSINVGGVIIRTSEHLYQACRFPDYPEIQEAIINEPSPMNAKFISRKYAHLTRKDWDEIRINLMKWCLHVKLAQNWEAFSSLLLKTGNKPIVEFTRKDKVWGATLEGDYLIGINALGRLLMDLRESYAKKAIQPYCIESPKEIDNFSLYSFPIGIVCNDFYVNELHSNFDYSYSLD